MRKFRDRLKEDMKDQEFKEAFEEEEIFASVAIQISKLREQEGITQAVLAKELKTTQQTVSRLEQAENKSCSLKTLTKVAHVFNKNLEIRFF